MMTFNGRQTVVQWVMLGILALAVAGSTAFFNRDVYSKDEVDVRIESIKIQLNRIERNQLMIIDVLIKGDHGQVPFQQDKPKAPNNASS